MHDTEDCPQQAMVIKELKHSMHNVTKVSTLTYCDYCETFGHDTNDDACPHKDDDQTF
jgi:hypothetical protein